MSLDNEAAQAAADDLDLTELLSAELDKADGITPVTADVPEPEAETAQEKADRVRDEKGRFTKADEAKEAPKPDPKIEPAQTAALVVGNEAKETVKDAPAADLGTAAPATGDLRPPPGWSPAAKVAFAGLTPEVQQAVAKREEEINKGFAKLAEYKPLERYAEQARQSGTTLERALEAYTGIENTLRRDFVGGISTICQRQGVNPVALANVILARAGVTPSQPGETGVDQDRQRSQVDLSPLMQKISALENHIQQQQSQGVQSEIQRFASDPKHTFFENVKEDMGRLLNAGAATDLADAYDKACWASSEIRPLLIKQQSAPSDASAKAAAATQARQASKSITGSPIAGASAKGPVTSIEDDLRAHWDAAAV